MQNPASPRTARLINDRTAFDLLLEQGPLTRAQLRDLTGLSGPTVSELVSRLEAAGLVEPLGMDAERRRGPNAQLYGAVARYRFAVGIDVTAERISAAAVDLSGTVVGTAEARFDRAAEPHQLVLAATRAALPRRSVNRLGALVVGLPGLVDPATGDATYAANLPGWHANVLGGLRAGLPGEILLENEVNLAGIAEHRIGAARGHRSFALLSLGEGIGVAVVLEGRIHHGNSGGAGEAGYLPIGSGTFHELAGAAALMRMARAHGRRSRDIATVIRTAGDSLLDAVADRIAPGAAAICALLDPGLLVLGGPVGRSGGAALAARVQDRLRERAPQRVCVTAAIAPEIRSCTGRTCSASTWPDGRS